MKKCRICGNEITKKPHESWKQFEAKFCCSLECGRLSCSKKKKGKRFSIATEFRKKTGKYIREGYVVLYMPSHPNRDKKDCVKEHRAVMEKYLKRYLKDDECVHHIDGDRANNKIENLKLFRTRGEHTKYHWTLRKKTI